MHWGDASASAMLRVVIKMDGRIVASQAHETMVSGESRGVTETPGEQQPYQFVPLVLTGQFTTCFKRRFAWLKDECKPDDDGVAS